MMRVQRSHRLRDRWHRIPKWARVVCATVLPLLSVLYLAGCATTIHPPRTVNDPVTVYLVDYGFHACLLLPDQEETGVIEYAYGDWRYYAEGQKSLWSGIRAMCVLSRGTLGRRHLPEVRGEEVYAYFSWVDTVHSFHVERARADLMRRRLEAEFRRNESTRLFSPKHGMTFVHHEEHYSALNNCNVVLARWIRELGCETRGPSLFSSWKVYLPAGSYPTDQSHE
jgi:hypothetical protein